ncbi:hypothetical protein EJD97_015123, partial [Solanum chilense]
LKIDATRNFPENCGPFVCQNNGSRKIYPEFPSNTKHVKVDSRRSFPENCGPQKRDGSDTQCSVDADNKSCSEVESAESSNFELTCSEWNSLTSALKDGKKGGKEGEIIHKCSDILEDFKSLPDIIRPEQQYESVFMKKQMDLGVPQENSRNSAVMCGVSGHGLSTEYEHIHEVKQVRETLKLFDDVYTKLLQEDNAENP